MADEELKQYLQANLSAHFAIPEGKQVREASTFGEAVEAGWQMSTLGLGLRNELPDVTLPENSNRLYRIASQATTLLGDVPAMALGGFVGGGGGIVESAPAGPVAATLGGTVGAAAGAFAAPAMLRRFLMDGYAKGGVKDFSEFWDRGSAILYDGLKQGAVGGLSGAAGFGATAIAGTAVGSTTELATMLALGNAVEGKFKMPSFDEFVDAALVMGAVHGVQSATSYGLGKIRGAGQAEPTLSPPEQKLMETHALTGDAPMEIAAQAKADPAAHADFVSAETQVPEAVAGPLPEPDVSASEAIETPAAALAEVLGPEAPPAQPAETAVPGYVPVFNSVNEFVDAYYNRLREGGLLIRKEMSAEVAYDPRTDTVVNVKTGAVHLPPSNAKFALETKGFGAQETQNTKAMAKYGTGRTILYDPVLGWWKDKVTGEIVIPSRNARELNATARQLEPGERGPGKQNTARDKVVLAAKAQARAEASVTKSKAKLDARKDAPTEKMKAAHAEKEAKLADAQASHEKSKQDLKDWQDYFHKLLVGDPSTPASAEQLGAMSDTDLAARVQNSEGTNEINNRVAAKTEVVRRERAAKPARTADDVQKDLNRWNKAWDEAKKSGNSGDQKAAKKRVQELRDEFRDLQAGGTPPAPPAGPPAAQAGPEPTPAEKSLAKDAILSRVSFNEPTKETPFLTYAQEMYRDYIDKKDPIYILDKMLSGAISRAKSKLLSLASLDFNSAFGVTAERGVPIWGQKGFASESFNKVFKDIHAWSVTDYVATNVAERALELSRQVDVARAAKGEALMQKGDRLQLFNAEGAKSGEAKVIDPDATATHVKTRQQNANGGWDDVMVPREAARRSLIALVDGKEVRNVDTGIDLDQAQIQANGMAKNPEYLALKARLRAINDAVIQYGVDTQFIPKARADAFKLAETYVPLHRVMETDWSNPLSQIEGSRRHIINPFESYLKDWQYILRKSNENAAKLALHTAIELHGDAGGLVRIVKPEQGYGTISKADFERISGGHLRDVTPDDITVMTQAQHVLKPNQLAVHTANGLRIIEGPLDLIQAYGNLGHQEMSGIMKLLTLPAKLERGGIVNSLSFLVRHGIRNPLMSAMFSENNPGITGMFNSLANTAGNIKEVWNRGDRFQQAMADGALSGSVAKSFNDRGVLQAELDKLAPQTGLFATTWNLARNGLELMHTMATVTDNASKLGEYESAIEGGKSRLQAAYEARNVIPDSQRVGAQMRGLNALIPFLHMHLQGLDKIGQMVAKEGALSVGMRLAPLMYASAAFWVFNHNDSRMDDIPHEQRDLFWIIPTSSWDTVRIDDADAMAEAMARPEDQRRVSADGSTVEVNNGAIFRIPKPFEAGIVMGSGTERILDLFFKSNPDAFEGFAKSLAGGVMPNYIPAFAKPVLEQFSGKSTFTGNPLIPAQAEKQLPQYRYGPYTSEIAKALGKLIAPIPGVGQTNLASPTIIENYVQSYGGYIGSYALELADAGLRKAGVLPDPVKPKDTLADIPFIRSFVIRNPGANTQTMRDFYDAYDHHTQVINSVKARAAEGDAAELDRLSLIQSRDAAAGGLDGVHESIVNMGNLIRMINQMPDMTPREKRQQIDGLYYGMNETAKMGMAAIREMAKELEASQ